MKNNTNPLDQGSPEQRRRFLRMFGTAAALLPITVITGCSDDTPPPAPARSQPASEPEPVAQTRPPDEPQTEPDQSAPEPASTEVERVSLDDPTAQALGYKHDAANVDFEKYPNRAAADAANHYCRNCTLFQGGEGDDWAPCTLFQGRLVNANGWCSGYTPKAG